MPHFPGSQVESSGRVEVREEALSSFAFLMTLSFHHVAEEDYGEYLCEATNSLGNIRTSLSLARPFQVLKGGEVKAEVNGTVIDKENDFSFNVEVNEGEEQGEGENRNSMIRSSLGDQLLPHSAIISFLTSLLCVMTVFQS
ncbi:unnamed protein product [Darwinula stevensoni]|uniref:Immunoglobulin I-set domain-containing protein n=1 Tax=Darwinula stevensoni TaxID=69355 RepID=A0A7R8X0Z7_9CRUS|nr:unnamed protein product [Darwinula stevensoni]CAG0879685.1 unnamed protein product [Darwinula stevensoni]